MQTNGARGRAAIFSIGRRDIFSRRERRVSFETHLHISPPSTRTYQRNAERVTHAHYSRVCVNTVLRVPTYLLLFRSFLSFFFLFFSFSLYSCSFATLLPKQRAVRCRDAIRPGRACENTTEIFHFSQRSRAPTTASRCHVTRHSFRNTYTGTSRLRGVALINVEAFIKAARCEYSLSLFLFSFYLFLFLVSSFSISFSFFRFLSIVSSRRPFLFAVCIFSFFFFWFFTIHANDGWKWTSEKDRRKMSIPNVLGWYRESFAPDVNCVCSSWTENDPFPAARNSAGDFSLLFFPFLPLFRFCLRENNTEDWLLSVARSAKPVDFCRRVFF